MLKNALNEKIKIRYDLFDTYPESVQTKIRELLFASHVNEMKSWIDDVNQLQEKVEELAATLLAGPEFNSVPSTNDQGVMDGPTNDPDQEMANSEEEVDESTTNQDSAAEKNPAETEETFEISLKPLVAAGAEKIMKNFMTNLVKFSVTHLELQILSSIERDLTEKLFLRYTTKEKKMLDVFSHVCTLTGGLKLEVEGERYFTLKVWVPQEARLKNELLLTDFVQGIQAINCLKFRLQANREEPRVPYNDINKPGKAVRSGFDVFMRYPERGLDELKEKQYQLKLPVDFRCYSFTVIDHSIKIPRKKNSKRKAEDQRTSTYSEHKKAKTGQQGISEEQESIRNILTDTNKTDSEKIGKFIKILNEKLNLSQLSKFDQFEEIATIRANTFFASDHVKCPTLVTSQTAITVAAAMAFALTAGRTSRCPSKTKFSEALSIGGVQAGTTFGKILHILERWPEDYFQPEDFKGSIDGASEKIKAARKKS